MEQHKGISRKRNHEEMIAYAGNCGPNKKGGGIDKLPDDVLINILSHMSLKRAARASVLAHRWRYLWRFSHGTLRFDQRDTSTGHVMEREKLMSWVNNVVGLHQGRYIEGMVIRFEANGEKYRRSIRHEVDSWVYFAMHKEVERFELNPGWDDFIVFPIITIKPYSHGLTSPFCRLRTLRLAHVMIMCHVVEYFLASCPNLEELCIQFALLLTYIRVVDPPKLRILEISRCAMIRGLEVSAMNLASLTYGGEKDKLVLKRVPNLRELAIRDDLCVSFILNPTSYCSVQLEKLVLDFQLMNYSNRIFPPPDLPQLCSLKRLEVLVYIAPGRSLIFFTSLIKASPLLREFRIELRYSVLSSRSKYIKPTFPFITYNSMIYVHPNLKEVEMVGYTGSSSEDEFLLALTMRCPSIQRILIDTHTDYSDDPRVIHYLRRRKMEFAYDPRPSIGRTTTRNKAKRRTKRFVSDAPARIKFIVT